MRNVVTFASAVKIYEAKADVTIVLIACATVSYGPRKRGGEIVRLLNTRVFGWEAVNRIFITFPLFAQQAVSGVSEAHASLLSRICILLRELSGIRRQ